MKLEAITISRNGVKLLEDVNLNILRGEQWLISGPSGSGKTTLLNVMAGRVAHSGTVKFYQADKEPPVQNHTLEQNVALNSDADSAAVKIDGKPMVVLVEQQHHFTNLSNTQTFYYQQRFNSQDAADSVTVAEYLDINNLSDHTWLHDLGIHNLLDKPLIQLSNGENKRLQLVAALNQQPDILLLDSVFVGVDTAGREMVNKILTIIAARGIQIILVGSVYDIPSAITNVLLLENGKVVYSGNKDGLPAENVSAIQLEKKIDEASFFRKRKSGDVTNVWLNNRDANDFEFAVRMKNVTVKYGDKIIIHHLNWKVSKGERWCITGPNGSGKSTLLSLINGDNPQAYSNEIYLFDRRRGSGESIWDIKEKIGFLSPELHMFFERGENVYNVIASGLFDTIGLFRQLSESQDEAVEDVMALMNLSAIRSKPLFQLSLGQQRMVLLARALVKYPPLLILDEPCQGLDDAQANEVKIIVDKICEMSGTTLLYITHYERDIPESVDRFLKLEILE